MINGSTAFNNAVEAGGYPYTARIKYNNAVVDCNIISCSVIKGATGNEEFSVGTGFVPYVELELSDISTNLENKEIVLEIGVYVTSASIEWITIGYFTVTKAPTSAVRTTITAVGRISAVLTGIIPNTPATITVSSLINAIQTAVRNAGYQDFSVITTGVTIPTDVLDINITGLSCYDILGELAKILGCYVTENNVGNVVLFNYDTTNVINYDGDRMIKHPVFNSYDFELSGIKVVYKAAYETEDGESVPEKFFTTDPPIALTVQNPYITTESLFNTFCDNCLGLSYRPANVTLDYGDPRLEPFDVLEITDTNGIDYIVPCMYLTHTITGGLVTNIVAPGQGESEESSTTVGPLTQQLEKMSAQLLSVNDAVINRLKVTDLTAQRISAIVVDAINLTSDVIDAKNINVSQITATQAFIDALNAGLIDAGVITTDDLKAGTVSADIITAINLATTQINADRVNVTQLVAKQAFLDAVTAQVATLGYAHITNGVIDNAKINHTDVNGLNANYAHITSGVIDNAKIGYADVNDLNTHYASIDLANVNNAWVENGVIKDAAISDAQIIGVSANKLTAGTIDASNITVTNLNADNITAGTLNGQRIGTGSLSLDKLSEQVTTKTYVDGVAENLQGQIDGQIETWTGSVVPTLNNAPASSWTTADDKHKHVGDIYYVVNASSEADGYTYRFTESGTTTKTYSWTLIKDNQITKALQDILDMQGDISGIKTFDSQISSWKTDTDSELSSLKSRTSTLETDMGTKVSTTTFNELSQTVDENSSSITTLTQTTIPGINTALNNKANSSDVYTKNEVDSSLSAKADNSTVTTLSNTVNTVQQTATSNSSKISQLTTTLGTNADGTTKAGDVVHKVSAVEQDLDGFKLEVSKAQSALSGRGDNLVTNGSVYMGDNTNFSSFVYDGKEANYSGGSFTTSSPFIARNLTEDEYITVDVDAAKTYRLSFDAKSQNGDARLYGFVDCYDIDSNRIMDHHVLYVPGSLTTLARDINNGDTDIYLTDVSGFDPNGTDYNRYFSRGFILWDYVNSYGYQYPPETYSRRSTAASLWTDHSSIDYENNVIHLTSGWTFGKVDAGTYVSQRNNGGNYVYLAAVYAKIPTDWTHYTGVISAKSNASVTTSFREGTAKVKIGWLWNYGSTTTNPQSQMWITNVSFKLDLASESDVEEIKNNYVTKSSWTAKNNEIAASISSVETTTKSYTDGKIAQEVTDRNSAITQKANEITQSVSQTYATKTSVPTKVSQLTNDSNFATQAQAQGYADDAEQNAKDDTDTKLASYSTTVQMNSAITQKANEITTSVAATYATQTEVSGKADASTVYTKSEIDDTVDGINSTVQEAQASINLKIDRVTDSGDLLSNINAIADQITLLASQINFGNNSTVANELTTLNSAVSIDTTPGSESIRIGASNDFYIMLTPTELGFYQNGNKVAYISNNQLYITQSVVLQQMDLGAPVNDGGLGQWSWKIHPNGQNPSRNNLNLKWIG